MDDMNALIDELVAREIAKGDKHELLKPLPESPHPAKSGPPMSPKKALILGSLADSASTYAFLKQGRHEGNPVLQMFNKKHESVIPMGAAGAAMYSALYELVKKGSPRTANTLAGLLGGYHGALAGNNIQGNGRSYRETVDELSLSGIR